MFPRRDQENRNGRKRSISLVEEDEEEEMNTASKKSNKPDWQSFVIPSMPLSVLLEHLLVNSSDALVVYRRAIGSDITPVYSVINKYGQEATGKSPPEILGRTNVDVFGETPFAIEMDASVKKCCDTQQTVTIEHEVGPNYFESTYTYLLAEGSEYVLGLCRDVTERVLSLRNAERLRREAEQATLAKSLFVARISRDLRTPLMGVLNTAELLDTTELNEEQKNDLNIIKWSSEVLLTLSNDITDLSRVEEGKLELNAEPMDLQDCLNGTIEFCGYRAKQAGVNLSFHYDPVLSMKLRQDCARVRQLVYNVLFNAIKFTPSGGSVTVDARSVDAQPDDKTKLPDFLLTAAPENGEKSSIRWLQIDITDTGVGVPDEFQNKIFQAFSRRNSLSRAQNSQVAVPNGSSGALAGTSAPSEERGTGLGLAISRGLCSLLGGELSLVHSETKGPSTGSHFRVILPFGETNIPCPVNGSNNDQVQSMAVEDDNAMTKRVSDLKVLIADDHPVNRKILQRLLEAHGIRDIAVACDGVEAVKTIDKAQSRFDVVMMDVRMPNMDGVDAVNQLRKSVPKADWPYVVMLTANAMTGDIEDCRNRCSPNEYMTKPVRQADLARCLRDAVAYSSGQKEKYVGTGTKDAASPGSGI